MSDSPVAVSSGDRRQSTKDKLADLRNMSTKEVTTYLASPEFSKHGSKAVATNAKRLNTLMGDNAKSVTLEDSELMKNAISAIESAKYASGHEVAEKLTKARAYGYDAEKSEDGKGGTDMGTTADPDVSVDEPGVDDDDDNGSGDDDTPGDDDDDD
jgi:hypothetical protein